jgi:hypothetical protein
MTAEGPKHSPASTTVTEVCEQAPPEAPCDSGALETLFDLVSEELSPPETAHPSATPSPVPPAAFVGVRSAELLRLSGTSAWIQLRGPTQPLEANIAPEVDIEFLTETLRGGRQVLVEGFSEGPPLIIGVLATQKTAPTTTIKAADLELEGTRSVTLRSGRAGLRLHSDGEIELVGTRVSLAARGLMRVVGRVLRLN